MHKSNEIINTEEILISLLTFNSSTTIEECLHSLENQSNKNFKCFVFDNNSKDNIEELVKKFPDVKFVQIGQNNGYTGGHNFALHYFRKNYPNHRYMMILNPDTILSSNLIEEFQKLFRFNVSLYTCALKKTINDKNLWVNKNIHLPSFTFLGRSIKYSEFKKGFLPSLFVSGSCFVIDLKKFKEKYLFKDYFMYHDEIELSLRLKIRGKKILTSTKGFIIHSPKVQGELSDKAVYLLELNRLKIQSDLFSDIFTLINLPLYIFSRIVIFLIYRPMNQSKEYSKGITDGLLYFQKNINSKKTGLIKTIKFLFIENFKFQ